MKRTLLTLLFSALIAAAPLPAQFVAGNPNSGAQQGAQQRNGPRDGTGTKAQPKDGTGYGAKSGKRGTTRPGAGSQCPNGQQSRGRGGRR